MNWQSTTRIDKYRRATNDTYFIFIVYEHGKLQSWYAMYSHFGVERTGGMLLLTYFPIIYRSYNLYFRANYSGCYRNRTAQTLTASRSCLLCNITELQSGRSFIECYRQQAAAILEKYSAVQRTEGCSTLKLEKFYAKTCTEVE